MLHALRLVLPLTLAAAACGMPRPAQNATRTASARAAIIATSRAFSRHYEQGDAAAMVAIYTPDGVILPPGRAAMRGPEALRQYWMLPPGVRVLEQRATPDSIVVAGPVAYDWGVYQVRTQDSSGTARETHGKYVIVWRETAPGVWRMHVDMWNSGPPPGR